MIEMPISLIADSLLGSWPVDCHPVRDFDRLADAVAQKGDCAGTFSSLAHSNAGANGAGTTPKRSARAWTV